jgi:hypothetical protein
MKSKTTKAAGKASIHPLVGCFLVVETGHDTQQEKVRGDVKGSFNTQAEAERWIIDDAVDTFSGSDRSLQDGMVEGWGSDMYVCEIKRVCRPVPVVKITARIMDTPNDAGGES